MIEQTTHAMIEQTHANFLRNMSYPQRVLFLYVGFRILHNYSPKVARLSAITNASSSGSAQRTHLQKYNHYWRLR